MSDRIRPDADGDRSPPSGSPPPPGSPAATGRVLRNFGSLTSAKVLGDALTFGLFVVLSRAFGQEGLGQYSFAMALTGFLAILCEFGLYYYSIRTFSRARDDMIAHFERILSLRIVISIVFAIVFFCVLPFLPMTGDQRIVVVQMAIYNIIYAMVIGYGTVFVAREEMHVAALFELAMRGVAAAGAIAVILITRNLLLGLWIFPVSAVVMLVAAHVVLVRICGAPRIRLPDRGSLRVLRETTTFAVMELLQQLATRIDVIFLGFMLGAAAAGVYNAAYRIIFFFYFLASFVGMSIMPLASRLHVESQPELRRLFRRWAGVAVLWSVPASVGMWLVAPDLVRVVYGSDFDESITILRVLSALIFIAALKVMMNMFLMATDRQARNVRAQAIAVSLNALGNFVLIPIMGPVGAAVASVASESMVVVLFAMALRPGLGLPAIWTRLIIALAGSTIFVLIKLMLPDLSVWATIPIAVVVYGATLLVFREIRDEEIRTVMSALPGRARRET